MPCISNDIAASADSGVALECSICLSALHSQPCAFFEQKFCRTCPHVFHLACAAQVQVLGAASACPLCRAPFDAVRPLPSLGDPQFDELNWGYFRAMRFAGDFADYGTEIQIADFAKGSGSWHVENQSRFLAATDFRQPFSVEANRPLLSNPTAR